MVVFSPQIIENFRRSSADGLSIVFIVIWLAGDVFNILGAVLQGVLPTMIALAIYYTLADIVLMCQVFYYRGFTLTDEVKLTQEQSPEFEPLLDSNGFTNHSNTANHLEERDRSRSMSRLRRHLSCVDATHLSPVTPLREAPKAIEAPAVLHLKPPSTLQSVVFNAFSIILVCVAGIVGWWASSSSERQKDLRSDKHSSSLHFDVLGQVFGYLCAALYLGSRVPQLLLNYRRKSTEGVSLLFFLFACLGNLTYDLSIFAYSPICRYPGHCQPGEAASLYGRYILLNASWIAGSLGTLLLDMAIFVQFFLYQRRDVERDVECPSGTTSSDDRGRGQTSR